MKFALSFIVCLSFSLSAPAKVLQEGWYKVYLGNAHMGYLAHRYEFEEKSKQFRSTYFLKFNALGGNKTESMSAIASQTLKPLSYQFTNKEGDATKTIDATFKKDLMEGTIVSNGKSERIQKKLQKGTLLSSFLVYLMLQNPSGIKKNQNFSYNAIAEEDGTIYGGNVHIQDEEVILGQNTFKTINSFKGDQWISSITSDGVMLSARSPVMGIRTELSTRAEATKGFPGSDKTINSVFTQVPSDSFYNKYAMSMKSLEKPAVLPSTKDAQIKELVPAEEPPPSTINPEKQKQMSQGKGNDVGLPPGVAVPPGKGIKPPPTESKKPGQ